MSKTPKSPAKPKGKRAASAAPPIAAPPPEAKGPKPSKKPKEKTIQVKTKGPFVVGAREEELDLVQHETHSCGGGFEIEMEEVRAPTETAGPLDVLKTMCAGCGAHVDFLFDISSFYDDGESQLAPEPRGGDEAPEGEDDQGGWLS